MFIQELNKLTGKNFRIPKRSEWLYAAKGGLKSKGYTYSGSNILSEVAWYSENAKDVHNVATKKPNELGIYDMSGNAWEWADDNGSSTNSVGGAFPVWKNGNDREKCKVNPTDNWSHNTDAWLGLRLVLPSSTTSRIKAKR